MRIIRRRRGGRGVAIVMVVGGLSAGYADWSLNRPLPSLKPTLIDLPQSTPAPQSKFGWPSGGQAAIGVIGTNVIETNGQQKAAPIASAAKIITALVVLDKKPLAKGQQGPIITLGADDVARYQHYAANDGSVVTVRSGEQISEYQMLQTILLPSANNMADSLAVWAYGSLENYAKAANVYVSKLGLSSTKIGSDASGLSPDTTSSASDLVRLGKLAMDNPVLAEIVGQSSAGDIPVAGTIKNVNFLLGTDGVIGVKTGNTEEAGGVFVAAAEFKVNGKRVITTTAIIGAPSLFAAMKQSLPLIDSARNNFKSTSVIKAKSIVGKYNLPWGGSLPAVASHDLSLMTWGGKPVSTKTLLKPIDANTAHAGLSVGQLIVPASATTNQKSVTIKLSSNPIQPSAWWRLIHPFFSQ